MGDTKMDRREIGLGIRTGTSGGLGNEPLGFLNCWENLEQLSDWRLLRKHSAPWIPVRDRNALHLMPPLPPLNSLFIFRGFWGGGRGSYILLLVGL
jgi:hypothetical protein